MAFENDIKGVFTHEKVSHYAAGPGDGPVPGGLLLPEGRRRQRRLPRQRRGPADRRVECYPESEKFPVVGGSLDKPVDDAPGTFPVDDADNLDYMLHFPADKADLIDDAASLTHMMNANSFTCGVFHVKNSADVSVVTDALRQNVQNTQWMCGFPDKLVVLTYGEYVVALFGADDLVDDFVNTMTATYTGVQTACDEPIQ